MNYEEKTPFEINKAVAIAEGLKVAEIDDSNNIGMTTEFHQKYPNTIWVTDGESPWRQYDPCNDWEDGGPIIIENKISVSWVGTYWSATSPFGVRLATVSDKTNPLRAAMIVYLKMKEDV